MHAFHVPWDARPDVVRFDPDAVWPAAFTLDVGLDAHRKALASDPTVACRVRAAAALGKDGSLETVAALARAVRGDKFWGVAAEAAGALAEIRTPSAREALLAALPEVKHPKARRAVVRALGAFRGDEVAAEALRGVLSKGDASLFVEAEAAEALGRTRVPSGRAVLEKALATKGSWAETIRAACVRGLGHLGVPRGPPHAVRAVRVGPARARADGRRHGSAWPRSATRMVQRDDVRERLEAGIDDRDFRVQMAAIAALRLLGDERSAPALARGAEQATDGRVRRACRAAMLRIGKRAERTTEVARLSDAVETLRREVGGGSTSSASSRAGGSRRPAPAKREGQGRVQGAEGREVVRQGRAQGPGADPEAALTR